MKIKYGAKGIEAQISRPIPGLVHLESPSVGCRLKRKVRLLEESLDNVHEVDGCLSTVGNHEGSESTKCLVYVLMTVTCA